jgi:hypothetical protein
LGWQATGVGASVGVGLASGPGDAVGLAVADGAALADGDASALSSGDGSAEWMDAGVPLLAGPEVAVPPSPPVRVANHMTITIKAMINAPTTPRRIQ